jgi:protease I
LIAYEISFGKLDFWRKFMKQSLLITAIAIFLLTSFIGGWAMSDTKDKKIVMIIAKNDFRDEEYKQPRAIFEKNGIKVTVASSTLDISTGMLGVKVKPDILYKDIKVEDYDALIFVGGIGAKEYWDDTQAHQIAKNFVSKGKVLGAICIAPVTIARAGILKGKKSTVFSSEKANIQKNGANYTGKSVEKDGKIITADGPSSATEFGEAILNALK